MGSTMTPLSILDLSPVSTGSTGADALRNTLDLARFADTLGYTRYWVAEHHNLPSIASSAPDIMIGQIAAITTHMRVGSGGVMLPNHAPLMVAERFKVLEALFPGRIDLGLGRAPGTDQVTSYALRNRQGISEQDDFLERFNELMLLETRAFPIGHPFHAIRAMPAETPLPPIYLLGSSDYSAQLAAQIGAAFSFAHHFATFDAAEAMNFTAIISAPRRRTPSPMPFSAPRPCAPTVTQKPIASRRPSISISCAAPRANISPSPRRRKQPAIPTRPPTAPALRKTGRNYRSAVRQRSRLSLRR